MRVTHTLTVEGTCPADGRRDCYEVSVHLDRFVRTEDVTVACRDVFSRPCWQEDGTQRLADMLRARVVTEGTHVGVQTRCECDQTHGA